MKFTLTINMDNAAFEDNPNELVEILESITEQIRNGYEAPETNPVHDSNGNKVGEWKVTK